MADTKQRILDISLNLFARQGFSAVSIRDICRQVNIKESTVYYHFTNKQAILDELLRQFQERATALMEMLTHSLAGNSVPIQGNYFGNVCDIYFERYLMDDFCNKVMRILMIEQLGSREIAVIYDEWMFHRPLAFQSSIFSILNNLGVLKAADCDYLALTYYAPIFLLAQRWLFSGDLSEDNKAAFRSDASKHIQNFFSELGGH